VNQGLTNNLRCLFVGTVMPQRDDNSSTNRQAVACVAPVLPFEPKTLAQRSADSPNLDGSAQNDNEL
jgi:hypothetical protein